MISEFTVFIFLIGIFILFLGFVISTQGCADMLNGFNKDTYDEKKSSKIIGKIFLISGTLMILTGIITLLFPDTYLNLSIFLQKILMFLIAPIVLIMCYKLDRHAKIKR